MNVFEQVFTITADDNVDEEYNDANGTYVDLPFLENGYDWYQYVTVDPNLYNRRTAKRVGINYLPQEGSLLDVHINNHMAFMRPRRLPTDENYALTHREMELDRCAINQIVCEWLKQFILYCAVQVGITYPERPLRNWNDFIDYVERYMKNRDDAMLVLKALVISFDYVPDFRRHITNGVMVQRDMTIITKKNENRRNFCEMIVTHRHNLLRKQINKASLPRTGYQFRVIRPPKVTGQPEMEERTPKYFSEWMLEYNPKKCEVVEKSTKKTQNSRKKKTRRSKTSYNTDKNIARTKEDIMEDLDAIEIERKELLAELDVLNSKPAAVEAPDDNSGNGEFDNNDNEAVFDNEEDNVNVAFQTQTITQFYPKSKSDTPNPRSSPRLKKNSPLMGQYSELEDDPKTDEDDVIFLKEHRNKAKRNSPQAIRNSPSSKKGINSDIATEGTREKRNTGDKNKGSNDKNKGSSDKNKGSSDKNKGSSHKGKNGSGSKRKHKRDDSSDVDSDDEDMKTEEYNDKKYNKLKRQIYKNIRMKKSKKKKNDDSSDSSSSDDESRVKRSSKKKRRSSKHRSDTDSDDSDSDDDKKRSAKKRRRKMRAMIVKVKKIRSVPQRKRRGIVPRNPRKFNQIMTVVVVANRIVPKNPTLRWARKNRVVKRKVRKKWDMMTT